MKEMVYSMADKREVLAKGVYKGRKYFIISCGISPSAYVEYRNEMRYGSPEWYDCPCHEGIDYDSKDSCFLGDLEEEYIGWHYSHPGDYVAFLPKWYGKKWTTEEIFDEVKKVIEYLNNLANKSIEPKKD